MGLSIFAKNSGWQIVLAFCFFWAKPKEKGKSRLWVIETTRDSTKLGFSSDSKARRKLSDS